MRGALIKRIGPPVLAGDYYWGGVTVLCPFHTDGTNLAPVRYGNPSAMNFTLQGGAVVNANHPFNGQNTMYFNGAGAYLDITHFISGNTPASLWRRNEFHLNSCSRWTVEMYVWLEPPIPADVFLIGTYSNIGVNPFTPYGWAMVLGSSGKLQMHIIDPTPPGSQTTSAPASNVPTGEWVHLCSERDGPIMRTYIKGQKAGEKLGVVHSVSDVPSPYDDGFNPTGLCIGAKPGGGSGAASDFPKVLKGSVAWARITKGVPRYGCGESFVPDLPPFLALPLKLPPLHPRVSCLLKADGTPFVDSSSYGNVVTTVGTVTADTAIKKYGAASARSQSADGALLMNDGPQFTIGQNAFGADMWVYRDTDYGAGPKWLCGQGAASGVDSGFSWSAYLYNSNRVRFFVYGASFGSRQADSPLVVPLNTMTHLAFEWMEPYMIIYQDGAAAVVSDTGLNRLTLNDSPGRLGIFSAGDYAANRAQGLRIDEFRMVNGMLPWGGKSFTPEANPYLEME